MNPAYAQAPRPVSILAGLQRGRVNRHQGLGDHPSQSRPGRRHTGDGVNESTGMTGRRGNSRLLLTQHARRGGETPALRWVIDMSFYSLHDYNTKKRRLGR